jgi:Putative adhesin
MNPLDELAALLPPAPVSQELPRRELHKADLLAAIAAGSVSGSGRRGWRRPAARRWLLAASSAIAVVVVAVLAAVIPRPAAGPAQPGTRPASSSPGSRLTATRHWSVPAAGLSKVTLVTIKGQVTVTGGATSSVAITATPRYQGSAPTISSRVSGGTLAVTGSCPQEPHCQVSLTVVVPAGLLVHAHAHQGDVTVTRLTGGAVASSEQGDVTVSQLSGQVTATTDQGDVNLTAVAGSVTAHSDQGTINAVSLAATNATLTTDQGDVDAVFRIAPRLVLASSQEGAVYIQLPSKVTYHVIASAQLGGSSVTVPQSPGSPHVIKASSQLGSVTVTG